MMKHPKLRRLEAIARVKLAALVFVGMLAGALTIGPVRTLADGWYGDFVRDANYYLDVNCKVGCGSSSQASPAYTRIEDGATTNLAQLDTAKNLLTGISSTFGTEAATGSLTGDGNNAIPGLGVNASLLAYNGSNYDRVRSGCGGTGDLCMGFATTPTVNAAQSGTWNVQTVDGSNIALIDAQGNGYNVLCGAASTNCAKVNSVTDTYAIGMGVTTGSASLIYNGSTWDRLRECVTTGYACVSFGGTAQPVTTTTNSSGAQQQPVYCDKHAEASGTTAAVLITHSASTKIHICTIQLSGVSSSSLGYVQVVHGNGTTCGTGVTPIDLLYFPAAANVALAATDPIPHGEITIQSGDDVCSLDSNVTAASYAITYNQS